MILITGSTGNTGGELSRLLSESGHEALCMTRRVEAQQDFERRGIRAVLGDFDDPESLEKALENVRSAFLVCTPDGDLEAREIRFIDAARKAGVEKIVKVSALLADPAAASPNLRMHAAVEQHLKASGLRYTILQPNGFMQTFFWMVAPAIQANGALLCPAGDGRCAMVDVRDVARAAWVALTQDGHDGNTYRLTGPESLDMAALAERFSRVFGKPVGYMNVPPEPMMQEMRQMGVPENSVQHVAEVFRLIQEDQLSFTTSALEELGIEPRNWERCAADLASGATAMATSFNEPQASV
ncbi:MAG: SDR family oxidoreductase [Acidobacteriota bacterium]